MFRKSQEVHQNTFWVINKGPKVQSYFPNSSISPFLPDSSKYTKVTLRFDPKREYYHPDDNDVIFDCNITLYSQLEEGMFGIGTWKKKELLDFTPINRE